MSSSINKTDFLRFNAYSIKELITRKLAQDSKFTDQIYEGSNLAVLIDIVSYMYQCLVYQLNNAAAESMFSDTNLYENIIRLVKFLDYNPKGGNPSQLKMTLAGYDPQFMFAEYSYVNTNKTDSKGKQICYSICDFKNIESDAEFKIDVVNGIWNVYNTIFTSSGTGNETFILNGIKSDSNENTYVSNNFIRVFVNEGTQWERWEYDSEGIFISSRNKNSEQETEYISLASSTQKKFTIGMTEDKSYEIKFGDGIIGKKLSENSKIMVLYLDSNGPDGDIDFSSIDWTNLRFKIPQQIKSQDFSLRKTLYGPTFYSEQELNEFETKFENGEYTLGIDNSNGNPLKMSTAEESVDEIRTNAPNWFKSGYRLITKNDYETFFKNNSMVSQQESGSRKSLFNSQIIDVKCMNNVDYVTKFYKWLYVQGLNRSTPNGKYYFTGDFFNRNKYYYIDPSDSNNIYLWIKTKDNTEQIDMQVNNDAVNNMVKNIKMTTTEINLLNPITVYYNICNSSVEYAKTNYMIQETFDMQCETTIEITLADNVSYVSNSIQNSVYQIIVEEFNQNRMTLGYTVDPTKITNKIYEINGVQNVRTIWRNKNANDGIVKVSDGISFISWTDNSILDEFEDMTIGNCARKMEDFQYPVFNGEENLMNRIVVIKKQMSTINTITF